MSLTLISVLAWKTDLFSQIAMTAANAAGDGDMSMSGDATGGDADDSLDDIDDSGDL